MVSLMTSYTVKPAVPTTPNVRLQLTDFDQLQGPTHAPTIYFYRQMTHSSVSTLFDTMKNSLSQALVQFYPLAGRLESISGSRFQIHCNDMGAQLLEAEAESEIDDYGDFSPSPKLKELVPRVNYSSGIFTEFPLLLVQLTKFRCGGISIGVALSHIVCDGLAALHFISSWSTIARGENPDDLPILDRTVSYMGDPLAKPRFDHDEFNPPPLLNGKENADEERKKEITVATLKLTVVEIGKLKNKANTEVQTETGTETENRSDRIRTTGYSRYEAVAGHVWRCACKARKHSTGQLTTLGVSVDCRQRLCPPLPHGYFGNAILLKPAITTSDELGSKPLGYASSKIRETVVMVNNEYVRSAMDYLKSQEDLTMFKNPFHTVGCTLGTFRGNPNVAVTSWLGLPIYDADFGWGKPIHMGPASIGYDGKCFIIPGGDEDGSLTLTIGLQLAHMDDFKKFFYEDI